MVQHLLSHYQDFLADYGMVWVGDDDADSDYEVLEETPSSVPSSLSGQQQAWNPSKTARLHLIILPAITVYIKSLSPPLLKGSYWVFKMQKKVTQDCHLSPFNFYLLLLYLF